VVPGDADVFLLAQELNTLVRVRPVADHIPEAPYFLHPSPLLNVLQHGGKSFQIRVNIGNNGVTHLVKI